MITLDTSGVIALPIDDDANHGRAVTALIADRGPFMFPLATLSEAAYLLERRYLPRVVQALLRDLAQGVLVADCGGQDFARIAELTERSADLPLGVANAAVIACAEHHGGRVLTFDLRHVGVVGREGRIEVVP